MTVTSVTARELTMAVQFRYTSIPLPSISIWSSHPRTFREPAEQKVVAPSFISAVLEKVSSLPCFPLPPELRRVPPPAADGCHVRCPYTPLPSPPPPPPPSANSAKFTPLSLSLRSTLSRGPFLPPPSVVRLPLPYIFITLAPPAARRRRWLQRSCKFDRQGVMYVDLFEAEIHGGFDKRPTLIRFVRPAVHAQCPSLLTS